MNSTASPNGPPYVKPGNWPDPDMLPVGWLGPHPGKDKERASHYTQDEAAHRIHPLGHLTLAR